MDVIREFFKERGLVYLERSRIADPRMGAYAWSKSPYAANNREEFADLTARYGDAIRRSVRAPVEIRHINDHVGWGVWAMTSLHPGDFVGEYCGVLQEATESPPDVQVDGHFLSDYAWNYPDELPDGTEFEVNALNEGNELRFVNHSSRPNLVVDHTLVDDLFVTFFRVIRAVRPGEQLTVDYGEEYWSGGFRQRSEL